MPKIAVNKKARFDYEILETYEAGIQLFGHEVKAIRTGTMNLKGSYVVMKGEEAYLLNAHISRYAPAGPLPHYDPYRSRKLLLHRKQLDNLVGKSQEAGLTIVPISAYTKNGKIKVEIGVGRGKKKHDKRADKKEKDIKKRLKREYGI